MRKLLSFALSALLAYTAVAQNGAPQAMKYQAVLHDISGNTLVNQTNISIRVNILKGSQTGAVSYSEIHNNVSTNAFGVINLEIGKGTPENNTFSSIDWGSGDHYIRIEMQIGATGYTEMGVSQLLSVPYALYAGNAGNSGGQSFTLNENNVPRYSTSVQTLVNSGIYQDNNDSVKINGTLTIQKPGMPSSSYTMPSERGVDGDVLMLDATGHYSIWSSSVKNSLVRLNDSIILFGGRISNLENTVARHSDSIARLNDSIFVFSGRIITLGNTVARHSDSIVVFSGRIITLGNTVARHSDSIVVFSGRIITLENTVSRHSDSIVVFSGRIITLENTVASHSDSIVVFSGRILALENIVARHEDSIVLFSGAISTLKDTVNAIAGEVYNYSGRNDNEIAYWDNTAKRFVTTPRITYKDDTVRIANYYMPVTSVGKQNTFVMVNSVGDGLEFKTPKTKGPVSFSGDTIVVDTVRTYWIDGINAGQVSNRGLSKTNIGIGTNDPKAILHTDSGHIFFAGLATDATSLLPETPITAGGNGFLWNYHRASLRVGGTDGTALWDNSTKKYSIGLGFNANPLSENGIVIGTESKAWGDYTFTLGSESEALAKNAFSVGFSNVIDSRENFHPTPLDDFLNLFAIGNLNKVTTTANGVTPVHDNFVLGANNKLNFPQNSSKNFVIGHNNEITFPNDVLPANNFTSTLSIIIGNDLKQNFGYYSNSNIYEEALTRSIAIGNGIVLGGVDNIAIGSANIPPLPPNYITVVSRSIGKENITIGKNIITLQSNNNISIGTNNYTEGRYNDATNGPGDEGIHHPGSITIGKNIRSDYLSARFDAAYGAAMYHGGNYRGGNITIGQSERAVGIGTHGMFNILIGSGIDKDNAYYYGGITLKDVVFETNNPAKSEANKIPIGPNGIMTTGGTIGSTNIGSNNFVGREGIFSITIGSGNLMGDYDKNEKDASYCRYGHGIAIGNGLIYSTGTTATPFMSQGGGIILGNRNEIRLNETTVPAVFIIAHGKVRKNLNAGGDLNTADYNSRRDSANLLELNENGNLYIKGNLYTISDKRLKKNINKLELTVDPLNKIKAYSFQYKSRPEAGTLLGFMAQDVQEFFPELVSVGSDGGLSLNYIGLVPVLWNYTQTLQKKVEDQGREIELLKEEISEIRRLLLKKLSK
jgi:hypothetical protein